MSKQWLKFVEVKDTGKTKVWNIHNSDNGSYLGQVKWNGGWRQYVFAPEGNCIWNVTCLNQLSDFVTDEINKKHAKETED